VAGVRLLSGEGRPSVGRNGGVRRPAPSAGLAPSKSASRPEHQWADAAAHAHIYLLSPLPAETVEELFATPLESADQVARLIRGDGPVLLIPDAHKALVEVAEEIVEQAGVAAKGRA
jgi:hypothetical protein